MAEIDDSGFYREDFSTESPWEVFNAQLVELFQDWDLGSTTSDCLPLLQNELFECKWDIRKEKLEILKREIEVSYYRALTSTSNDKKDESNPVILQPVYSDLMSSNNSFGQNSDLHPVARFYGLRSFVIISSAENYLNNPSEFSFFLSSATIVAAETNSTVPIFIPVFDPRWNYFIGVHVTPSIRIDFDVVALENGPQCCKYLSGLINIFREKLTDEYNRTAAKVSVRNIYVIENIMTSRIGMGMRVPFSQIDSSPTFEEPPWRGGTYFIALPYGYFNDSKAELTLFCTWPEISETFTMDSELRTDFIPSKSLRNKMTLVAHTTSYLSAALKDFINLSGCIDSLESFVGRNFSGITSGTESNPLEKLTRTGVPQLISHRQGRHMALNSSTPQKKLPGPIYENELLQMIYYIFPDLQADPLFPYLRKNDKDDSQNELLCIKSAQPDSFVLRLSCLLTTCNAHFGGKSGMAQLWASFTRELRCLLDHCIKVPGVAPGFPDTRTCLLHQKLQMLNICMERREMREWSSRPEAPKDIIAGDGPDETEDDEDEEVEEEEFYDCSSNEDQSIVGPDGSTLAKPEGRQTRLGDLKLIDSDEPLYVPVTQDPVPKTEDQLQDDAEVMLRLGPGSGLSTQMMCTSLLSDMEAFKAANPFAKIEDFIRWYSPRDWEETIDADGVVIEGKLSARMLSPDNTWQTIWKHAQPVPAWRQKRLFDDTNEALKVLHYLETRTIGEIYDLILIPTLHSAVLKLKDIINDFGISEILNKQIEAIFSDLSRLARDIEIMQHNEGVINSSTIEDPIEPILKKIADVESLLFQYKSLKHLYRDESEQTVKNLFRGFVESNGEYELKDKKLLSDKYWREHLVSKEYVIRDDGCLAEGGQPNYTEPQFLRAIITGDRVRLCGAFAKSTTFV